MQKTYSAITAAMRSLSTVNNSVFRATGCLFRHTCGAIFRTLFKTNITWETPPDDTFSKVWHLSAFYNYVLRTTLGKHAHMLHETWAVTVHMQHSPHSNLRLHSFLKNFSFFNERKITSITQTHDVTLRMQYKKNIHTDWYRTICG